MKKILLSALLASSLVLSACGASDTDGDKEETTTAAEETTEQTSTAAEETPEEDAGATIKTSYSAPHGDQSMAVTYVVMDGDKIADVVIDEFQYLDAADATGVPNSDAGFGEQTDDELVLASKTENSEYYSEMMKKADSTVPYAENITAIQDFAKGKTVEEVEAAIEELDGLGEDDPVTDVVSGATLADTAGYLQSVVDTAKDGLAFVGVEDADLSTAKLSYGLAAPHGEDSFAVVSVLSSEEGTVLAAAIDEFQYVDPADFEGVPNSDGAFGENYADDTVLASKMLNNDAYSAMMKEYADATTSYADNMNAVIDYAEGKTADEIEAGIAEIDGLGDDDSVADVVTGATFADTAGYLQAIVDVLNK